MKNTYSQRYAVKDIAELTGLSYSYLIKKLQEFRSELKDDFSGEGQHGSPYLLTKKGVLKFLNMIKQTCHKSYIVEAVDMVFLKWEMPLTAFTSYSFKDVEQLEDEIKPTKTDHTLSDITREQLNDLYDQLTAENIRMADLLVEFGRVSRLMAITMIVLSVLMSGLILQLLLV